MASWADSASISASEGMVETGGRVEEVASGIWGLKRGTAARDWGGGNGLGPELLLPCGCTAVPVERNGQM